MHVCTKLMELKAFFPVKFDLLGVSEKNNRGLTTLRSLNASIQIPVPRLGFGAMQSNSCKWLPNTELLHLLTLLPARDYNKQGG